MTAPLPVQCEIEITPLVGRPGLGELIVFFVGDALVAHGLR